MNNRIDYSKNVRKNISLIKKDLLKKIKEILRSRKNILSSVFRIVDPLRDEIKKETDVMIGMSKPLGCFSGCSYCCHQSVSVTSLEVFRIASDISEKYPNKKQFFIDRLAVRAKELEVDLTGAREKVFPCPFLNDSKCMIYEYRPSPCRIAHSVSSDACKNFYIGKNDMEIIDGDFEYIYRSRAISDVVDESVVSLGYDVVRVEFVHSLFLAMTNDSLRDDWMSGKKVFPLRYFSDEAIFFDPTIGN